MMARPDPGAARNAARAAKNQAATASPAGVALRQAEARLAKKQAAIDAVARPIRQGGNMLVPGLGNTLVDNPIAGQLKRFAKADEQAAVRKAGTAYDQAQAAPKEIPVAKKTTVPPPAKLDPVSGKPLSKGNPVPTAYSGSASDRAGITQSSAKAAARATFKPPYLGAKGRVTDDPPAPRAVPDPVSGLPLKKGDPVHTAYSGDMNSKVALGLRTAGTAVGMGFKPPYLGAKGRVSSDTPKAIPPAAPPKGNADAMQRGFDSVRQVGAKK